MAAQEDNCFGHSWNPGALCIVKTCRKPIHPQEPGRMSKSPAGCMSCNNAETSAEECHCDCHRCDGCKTSPLPIGTSAGGAGVVGTSAAAAAALAPPRR